MSERQSRTFSFSKTGYFIDMNGEKHYLSPNLPPEQLEKLSRSLSVTSITSVEELVVTGADRSLERDGESVRLKKCEDEEFIANAYKYCSRCLRGSWAKIPAHEFTVRYVSGGLTNYLYHCSLPDDYPIKQGEVRQVLIRIYGEILDNKAKFYEGVIFTLLSERGFGPKTYGVFHGGRIEEYIPYRHLYTRELADPTISKQIAVKVAEYHCMKLPLNLEPTWLWEMFERYLTLVATGHYEDKEQKDRAIFNQLKKEWDFAEEYEWLKGMLVDLKSDVMFCHNDFQEGNILKYENGGVVDVVVIDYEYSCYNYRGFDIGNHFCEWMYEYHDSFDHGYKVYEDGYPTQEEQILFVSEYVRKIQEIKDSNKDGSDCRLLRNIKVSNVDRLIHEANRFALASHMFWALWSVVQWQISKIDFGFVSYAKARMDTYKKQKAELGYK